MFGHLIEGDRIVARPDVAAIERALGNDALMARLNGEFLIVHLDKETETLTCVVDRFASVQLHYALIEGTLIGSFSFADACDYLGEHSRVRWDPVSMLEYLHFRRVHGANTLAEDVRFLRAGSMLEFHGGRIAVHRYFTPKLGAQPASLQESGAALAEAIARSVARKTSDGKSYGLFLSGGHDTRTVLAAARVPLTCYTVGFYPDTREILRARELTAIKKFPHRTLLLAPDHFDRIYTTAILQNGGQYSVANIFLGLSSVGAEVDVALCGTGIDYMFQGMYMPAHRLKLLGYLLYWRIRDAVPDDVTAHYLNAFSSRLKFADVDAFLITSRRAELVAALGDRLRALETEARQSTDDTDFIWDHMFLADPSRHYSYPDNLGMRCNVELRTPSFDNDVFDLFHSMPMEHRFDRRVVREALAHLEPAFLRVLSANDDMPIVSSARKTVYQLGGFLHRPRARAARPAEAERTWPSLDSLLLGSATFRSRCLGVAKSRASDQMPWLDFSKVGALAERWYSADPAARPSYAGDFLWNVMGLVTYISRYA